MNMNDTMNRVMMGMIVIILATGAYYVGRTNGSAAAKDPAGIELSDVGTEIGDSAGVMETESASEKVSDAIPALTVDGDAVVVLDQFAGSVVKIASVTLPQLGWVAVRDSKGWVLGAGRFVAGTSENVEVILLRGTVAGESYQVLLYNDDGDKEFDLHKDSLVMNADASVAGTTFTAQ